MEEEREPVPVKGGKKKKPVASFQMLMDEDDDMLTGDKSEVKHAFLGMREKKNGTDQLCLNSRSASLLLMLISPELHLPSYTALLVPT